MMLVITVIVLLLLMIAIRLGRISQAADKAAGIKRKPPFFGTGGKWWL